MNRTILTFFIVVLCCNQSHGQKISISNLYEQDLNSSGKQVNYIYDMVSVYDEFQDLYQIFPNKEYFESQDNSDLGYNRFVMMRGQIGSGTLVGDIRVYMLIFEFTSGGNFLKNNDSGNINILTNDKRIPVKYVSVNDNESKLLFINGFDEGSWESIINSNNPRIRVNNQVISIDSTSTYMMEKLTKTIDKTRINMFDIELTFSDGISYPDVFNREIIRKTELNVIPLEEGVVDFDIRLNPDGSVKNIRWDPIVGGVEPDISNLEEVKKNIKEGWVFGIDTVSENKRDFIELEMRITKK